MSLDLINHLFQYQNVYLVLLVVVGVVAAIFSDRMTPSNAFLAGTLFLVISGVVEVEILLDSISNAQIITIFLLIFITLAIRRNSDIDTFFKRWFKQSDSPKIFTLKLTTTVAFFSTFLNNTPVVAMLTGNVQHWANRKNVSPSKFLIPLSYAAILGGMVTVIGTSTNLVLQGLLSSNGQDLLFHYDFLVVGGIVCVICIAFLTLVSDRIMPNRQLAISQFAENRGQYLHEIVLKKGNSLVGKSVQEAGLKNLEGIYLVEIGRGNETITPVAPETIIQDGDYFYIAGETSLVLEYVQNTEGLILPSDEKLDKVGVGNVVEVVVAANSKFAGELVKESNFREKYNASIIGIHRNGEKITGKIGSVRLKNGDLLLLLTGNDFDNRIVQDKNLFLLSEIRKQKKRPVSRYDSYYKWLQILVVFAVISGYFSFFIGLFLSVFLLMLFKFLTIDAIKREFNFDLLIVLACSLTLGKAFIDTGTADILSSGFLNLLGESHIKLVITGLFLFTVLLTSMVTNIAAVSIAFPIAFALSQQLGIPGSPFYLAIAFAASAAFLTPMGYQTNMMVYGPGGYKSKDFLTLGIPLLFVYTITSLLTIFWWYRI